MLYEQQTVALLNTCSTLSQHRSLLLQILAAKEAEIEDYKLSGAKVSRKVMETKKFDPTSDLDNGSHIDAALCEVIVMKKDSASDSASTDLASTDLAITESVSTDLASTVAQVGQSLSMEPVTKKTNPFVKTSSSEGALSKAGEKRLLQRPTQNLGKKAKDNLMRGKKLGL